MEIQLTDPEREVLVALLETRTGELLHELHHAVRHEYKDALRKELEVTQELLAKVAIRTPA